MQRSEAIELLKRNEALIRQLGATSLYLFGSTAQNCAGPDSDVDLFIDYDATKPFSIIDLAGVHLFLQDVLATEVDVTTRDSLHPRLREKIETSAIQIF